MIVLEGPDLAGKSTLAEALFKRMVDSRRYCSMVRHFTKVPAHFDKYWGYASCVQRDVILDRFHMSHVVYRHVEGAGHNLTPLRYELVDADITRVGGIVVVLAPPLDVLRSRHTDRPEMYNLDHILKVGQEFIKLAQIGEVETCVGWYKPKIDIAFLDDMFTAKMADVVYNVWVDRQVHLQDIINERPGSLQ